MVKNTPRQILGKVGALPGDIQRVTGSIATGASTINSMTARLDAAVRGTTTRNPVSGAIKSGLSGVTGALNRGAARVNAWASGLNSVGTTVAGTLTPVATASNIINQSITDLRNCQQVLHTSSLVVDAIMDSVTGHFHPRANEQVLLKFDAEWDSWAKAVEGTYSRLSPAGTAHVLESLARAGFGDEVFSLGSAIKKNSAGIFGGIADFEDSIHAFGGSYRGPVLAAKKIERGVKGIIGATERVANSINGMITTYQNKMGYVEAPNPILSYIGKIHKQDAVIALNRTLTFGGGAATLYSDGAVLGQALENRDWKTVYEIGKKTYGDARTILSGFGNSNDAMTVTELAKGYPTGGAAPISPDILDSLDDAEKAPDNDTGEEDPGDNAGDNNSEEGEAKDALVEDGGNEEKDSAGDNDDENAQEGSSDAPEYGKSDSYVCSGATMRCSFGDKSARLTVYPDRTVFLTGQPMANISDHTSLYNIAPFGKCHTTRYPATGAATAAAHGRLTPMPCVPGTMTNWRNGKDDYIIKGSPALLKSSYCKCCYGGIIRIVKDGQVDTGTADLHKQSIETAEEWTAKEQEELLEDKDTLLDGIQMALDLAGFAPGVGAIPDLMNAAIYAVRGDKLNASLSLLAAVPGIGDAAAAAKIAGKGVKAIKDVNRTLGINKTVKTLSKNERKAIARKFINKNVSKNDLLREKGVTLENVDEVYRQVKIERKREAINFYKKHWDAEKKTNELIINPSSSDFKKALKEKDTVDPQKTLFENKEKRRLIISHINGIDFNYPVEEVSISKGTSLYQYSTGKIGNYFTPDPNVKPNQLGISSIANGSIRDKYEITFNEVPEGGYPALRSTAKEITDTWSTRLYTSYGLTETPNIVVAEQTLGGGTQIFIPGNPQEWNLNKRVLNIKTT